MRFALSVCATSVVALGSVPAQQPKELPPAATGAVEAPAEAIVVRLTVLFEGRLVTDAGVEKPEMRTRVVDRKLQWRVATIAQGQEGGTVGETFEALAKDLARRAKDPQFTHDDPVSGSRELLPLRIEMDAGVFWGEAMRTWDLVCEAGFGDFLFVGCGTGWSTAVSIDRPVVDPDTLVVPPAMYHEPDDDPDPHRTVFDVHRDGRVVHDGRTVYQWRRGADDETNELRELARKLRAAHQRAGRVEKVSLPAPQPGAERGEPVERIAVPFLLRVDSLAQWRDVRRVFGVLTDPEVGFRKLQIGVREPPF